MRQLGLMFACILALLSACSPCPCYSPRVQQSLVMTEIPVWIDIRFNPKEREGIYLAILAWNYTLEGQARFFIASEDWLLPEDGLVHHALDEMGWGLIIERHDPLDEHYKNTNMLAVFRAGNTIRLFPSRMPIHYYPIVTLHELGHYLGLDDDEKGSELMRLPYGTHQKCTDTGTLQALAHRKHWRFERMRIACVN